MTVLGIPSVDFGLLLPVLAPVVALILILLVDAVVPGGRRHRPLLDVIALAGLVVAGAGVWQQADGAVRATACLPTSADDIAPLCSYVSSGLTVTLQAVVLIAAILSLLLALDGPGAQDRTVHHVLLLSAVAGAVALAGARDLATLVIALETVTLPAIGLAALRRDAQGAQSALTLLLTAVGSLGLLLLGVALLLLAGGTLHLDQLDTVLASEDLPDGVRAVAALGTALAVAGLGFKVSLVPFHLWTPDAYAGAPLPVAAFLSTVSKAAGVSAIVVLLGIGVPSLSAVWVPIVGVLAVVTMTVGNLVALRQRVAVRLLAWSAVAQAGWTLLPLASVDGTPGSVRVALAASAGYLLAYTVAALAVFAVVVLVARHHPAGEEHTLDTYRGLVRTEPVAAAVLGFALLCLAGLPPGIMGLVAKVVALRPLVGAGVWPVAVVAALNVALGLFYYLRWAGLLMVRTEETPPRWRVTVAEGLVLGGAAAGCVGLSVAGQLVAGLIPGVLR